MKSRADQAQVRRKGFERAGDSRKARVGVKVARQTGAILFMVWRCVMVHGIVWWPWKPSICLPRIGVRADP